MVYVFFIFLAIFFTVYYENIGYNVLENKTKTNGPSPQKG